MASGRREHDAAAARRRALLHFLPWLVGVGALSLVAAYDRRFVPVLECLDIALPGVTTVALDLGELLLGRHGWVGPLALATLGYLPIALGAKGPRVARAYGIAGGLLCAIAVACYFAVQLPIEKLRSKLDEQPAVSTPRWSDTNWRRNAAPWACSHGWGSDGTHDCRLRAS